MGLDICHVQPSIKTNDTMEFLTLDEFQGNPEFIEKYKHLIVLEHYENAEPVPVLYYIDKGYQRKRVTADFINEFENGKLYFSIDNVKKAKSFLEARPGEDQEVLEKLFQENFIDNFVEGESIFFISW